MQDRDGRLLVAVIGIFSIVVLEYFAMVHGLNGKVFAAAIGGIALIVGYFFGRFKKWLKNTDRPGQ